MSVRRPLDEANSIKALDLSMLTIVKNHSVIAMYEMKRPTVFFDRGGVLNEDNGYVFEISKLRWINGARKAVGAANDAECFVS